jgi:hypothetical protein
MTFSVRFSGLTRRPAEEGENVVVDGGTTDLGEEK